MKLTLAARLGAGYAVSILTLLVVVFATNWSFDTARLETARVNDSNIPGLDVAKRLLVAFDRMEYAEFLYFTRGSGRTRWYATYDEAAAEFSNALAQSDAVVDSPQEATELAMIRQQFALVDAQDRKIRTLLASGAVDAAKSLNEGASLVAGEAVREAAQAFYDINLHDSRASARYELEMLQRIEAIVVAVALAGVLAAGLLWHRAVRAVVAPLRGLQTATGAVAMGQLQPVDMPVAERTVELAALVRDFNGMARELARITEGLRTANSTLESQVEERTQALSSANERLGRMLTELRTVDKLKSDFMAAMSHELLTPINFITGFGAALDDELLGPLTPEQHQAVSKLLEGAWRLTHMVRNTLDYTLLTSHKLALLPAAVDYGALVADVAGAMTPVAGAKGIQVVLDLESELPDVWADAQRAAQVLTELIDNAVKFTPEGGRITVAVIVQPDAIMTRVSDNGDGIAPEALDRIFQPFYQADITSTREHGGMGLGLAIAHDLIERMGGTMCAASTPGSGTTFRFTLPRARPTAPALDARSARVPSYHGEG